LYSLSLILLKCKQAMISFLGFDGFLTAGRC
jgi:hypothetical protein